MNIDFSQMQDIEKIYLVEIVVYFIDLLIFILPYRKKFATFFKKLYKIIIHNKINCAIDFIVCIAICVFLFLLVPVGYDKLFEECVLALYTPLLFESVLFIYLLNFLKYKTGKKSIREPLLFLLIITCFLVVICLKWDSADKQFITSSVNFAFIILLFWIGYLIVVWKHYAFVSQSSEKTSLKILYPTREYELKQTMEKVIRQCEIKPLCISVEGKHGIGKRNFIEHMLSDLQSREKIVIKVDIDASNIQGKHEIIQYFVQKLQDGMEENRFYFSKKRKIKKIFRRLFPSKQIKFFAGIISLFFKENEETILQQIQDILSVGLQMETIFVSVNDINFCNVEDIVQCLWYMKKVLQYPRCMIVSAWDEEMLQELQKKGVKPDFNNLFTDRVLLTPVNYKEVLRYLQKQHKIWSKFGEPSVDLVEEAEKLAELMKTEIEYADSVTNHVALKNIFANFGRILEKELSKVHTAEALYDGMHEDVKEFNICMKTYQMEKQREFLEEFSCIQCILILNILKVVRPDVYVQIQEQGFMRFVSDSDFNIKNNGNDELVFALLYFFKPVRSDAFKRKKEFIQAFCEKKVPELYCISQNKKRYRELIRDKNYADIDMVYALSRITREHMEHPQPEDVAIVHALFTEAVPQRANNNVVYIWELIKTLFTKKDEGEYLMPDLFFWRSCEEITPNYQLADLNFVRDFESEIVKRYMPQALACFKKLFEFSQYKFKVNQALKDKSDRSTLKNELDVFIAGYQSYFQEIDLSKDQIDVMRDMVDIYKLKTRSSILAEDPEFKRSIQDAYTQQAEIRCLRNIFNGMIVAPLSGLFKQKDFENLIHAIDFIIQDGRSYSDYEKGQVVSLIEKLTIKYGERQPRESREKMCDMLAKFESKFHVDFKKLKIWLNEIS